MTNFTDRRGVNWDLDLNIGIARKLKARLNFDLDNFLSVDTAGGKTEISNIERIATDAILLFNIIFVVCEKQCLDRGISEEDFAESFDAATIEAATDALLDEIVNFSRPAKKKVLQHILQISREFSQKAGTQLDRILNDPESRKQISADLENHLTKLSTSVPVSVE